MSEWRDISTAPKDGTPILGYREYPERDFPQFFAVTWFAYGLSKYEREWLIYDGQYRGYGHGPFFAWTPTHWMPLPDGPTTGAYEGPRLVEPPVFP